MALIPYYGYYGKHTEKTEELKKEYLTTMSKGAKEKATLRDVENAWFEYRSSWRDGFSEDLLKYGTYARWRDKVIVTKEPYFDGCCSCHINPPCSYCVDGGYCEEHECMRRDCLCENED